MTDSGMRASLMTVSRMTESQHRQQMVALGLSLFQRGYATGGAGNLSLRLEDGNVLATPTGSCLGRLDGNTLSKLTIDGKHLSGDAPSKEVEFHLAIYGNRPQCRAVVHLHCTYLTALSCLKGLDVNNVIKPFSPYYVMRIGKLPLVEYFKPGDGAISVALAGLAKEHRAFLLANHGPVVTGSNLIDAVNNAEELEETARLSFLLQGKAVNYFNDEQIQALTKVKV